MKRSLLTGALVCVVGLLSVAAPALSLRPYRPEPVNFSMGAPAGAILGSAARQKGGIVSRPLRAPRRFNLVGLSWRGREREVGIAVRARRDGGRWTRWTPLASEQVDGPDPGVESRPGATSSPTWVGEADWVQYRTGARLPGLRLRFVNTRGTATAADRARTALRRAVSAGVASLAGAARIPAAYAQTGAPGMVSRADWGASRCAPRTGPEYGTVRAAFVHHTVNPNDYTREEAPDVVLAICRYHRYSNGWNDVGYNFLVDRFGTVYEGRAGGVDQPVLGAQAQGYNSQSTGIANVGTFSSVEQSPAAMLAMVALIRWKLPLHGASTTGTTTLTSAGGSANRFPAGRAVRLNRISGHRDTGATACPGAALYAQLPELRSLVGDVRPAGGFTGLRGRVTSRRASVAFGQAAPIAGTLTVAGAPPTAPLGVLVEARVGSRWRGVGRATTDSAGAFATAVTVRRSRLLRVRFPGGGGLRRSTSQTFPLRVRGDIVLSRAPTRSETGRGLTFTGRVRPFKRSVLQVLQQRRGERWRTVGRRWLRVRRGAFRGRFVPASVAEYRYYVVAARDRVTARGVSSKVVLQATRRGGGAGAP